MLKSIIVFFIIIIFINNIWYYYIFLFILTYFFLFSETLLVDYGWPAFESFRSNECSSTHDQINKLPRRYQKPLCKTTHLPELMMSSMLEKGSLSVKWSLVLELSEVWEWCPCSKYSSLEMHMSWGRTLHQAAMFWAGSLYERVLCEFYGLGLCLCSPAFLNDVLQYRILHD